MNYETGDILEINDKEQVILALFSSEGKDYAFLNEIENDDVTDNYYIAELIDEDDYEVITDEKELNRLFPLAQESLKKVMDENGIDYSSNNQ